MNTKVVVIIHYNCCFSLNQNSEIVLIFFEFSTQNTAGQAVFIEPQLNDLQTRKNDLQVPEWMKVIKIFTGTARKYLNQAFHCEANPCLHSLQSGLKNLHWGRFLNLSRAPASKFHLLMKLFLAPSWAFLYYKVIVSVLCHFFMYSKSAFSPFVLKLGKFWGFLSIGFRFTKTNKQTKVFLIISGPISVGHFIPKLKHLRKITYSSPQA